MVLTIIKNKRGRFDGLDTKDKKAAADALALKTDSVAVWVFDDDSLAIMTKMHQTEWQTIADKVKGMLVTFPGKKPSTLRVDQLDREQEGAGSGCIKYPDIVHFGIKPPQLSYAGCQDYQKAWREFVKFRHLLANMAKPTYKDRRDLEATQEELLKELKLKYLIIENFIPAEEKERVLSRSYFDEEEDLWKLGSSRPSSGPISKRPVSAAG